MLTIFHDFRYIQTKLWIILLEFLPQAYNMKQNYYLFK